MTYLTPHIELFLIPLVWLIGWMLDKSVSVGSHTKNAQYNVIGFLVSLATTVGLTVWRNEEQWKQNNTLEHFLFGQNLDFQGSEFNQQSPAVRVYQQDSTITRLELERWIENWKKVWVNYGGKSKDKYWKNRKAHIYKIYKLMKAERLFAIPIQPNIPTFEQFQKMKFDGSDEGHAQMNTVNYNDIQYVGVENQTLIDNGVPIEVIQESYRAYVDQLKRRYSQQLKARGELWARERPVQSSNVQNQGNDVPEAAKLGLGILAFVVIILIILPKSKS